MSTNKVIYGNIVTMDEKNPKAEAMVIRDKTIEFVGAKNEAQKFVDSSTEEIDFAEKTIYPGFIDAHSHMGLFSALMSGGPTFPYGDNYENNIRDMTKFIEENPGREMYKAFGFTTDADRGFPTHEMLDEMKINGEKFKKPIIISDWSGHLCWLNKAAMDKFMVDKEMVAKFGEDVVMCNSNGEPIGILKETPHFSTYCSVPVSLEETKESFLETQEDYLRQGYSMIADCGIEEGAIPMVTAMAELAQEGKFKLNIRAYYQIYETNPDPLKEVDRAIEFSKKYNFDCFKIIGIKIFLDGVNGGISAWTVEPYKNYQFKGEPYSGYKRWNYDRIDELAEIIRKANANGLSVELHAIGSGAARYALDAIEKAQAGIENPDFRNAIAHLNSIEDSDVPRFAKLNVIPVVAPQWYTFVPAEIGAEKIIFGEENYADVSPLQSYLNTGVKPVFHVDGDPDMTISRLFYAAVNKVDLFEDPDMKPRNIKERMTPYDAVSCMTKNSARALKEENNVGTLEVGKKANFIVYDVDFTDEQTYKNSDNCVINPISQYINGEKVL